MFPRNTVSLTAALLLLCLGLLLPLSLTVPASASLPPTISYTGQLLVGGSPVSGTYDFQFTLYNALTGGTQVGSMLTVSSVPVADGVFYVELGFGNNVFTGQKLFLQTAYALHPAGTYTTQSPRKIVATSGNADYATLSGSTQSLQGFYVSRTPPTDGQALTYSGSLAEWLPQTPPTPTTYTAGAGLALSGNQFSVAVPLSLTSNALNGTLVVNNTATGSGAYDGIQSYTSGSTASAVVGIHYSTGNGVYGQTATGDGVYGRSTSTGSGVYGYNGAASGSAGAGVYGTSANGTSGYFSGGGIDGVYAETTSGGGNGVVGLCDNGTDASGVFGYSSSGYGITGEGATGAGDFQGDVTVSGTLTAGTKDFKIDHPLDPEHKYLFHASIESDKMEDVYNGHVVTDAQCNATVTMPSWFQALNADFEYQLTVVGQFAQAVVAAEIQNNQFTIKTDKPNVKVSWQVTGVRHDAFALAHPLQVEQDKPEKEQGLYQNPEAFGLPPSAGIGYQREQRIMPKSQH